MGLRDARQITEQARRLVFGKRGSVSVQRSRSAVVKN